MNDDQLDHPELLQTQALADGELSGEEAQRARDHLATCAICQAELGDVIQLAALPGPAAAARPGVIALAWYRRRRVQIASLAVAAAAGVAIYAGTRPHPHAEAPVAVALAEHRMIEARVTWGDAGGYRAYDVPRAAEAPHEAISLAALADVEKRGDLHGVGTLALLDGDRTRAASYLERAGDTADVLADRAALALADGHPDRALALADAALARTPGHPAATWNRALALRDLGLTSGAAKAFREVAAHAEPGWAGEATQRATALESAFTGQLDLSLRVAQAASTLAATDAGLSADDARAVPGLARIALYDAIRAASDRTALDKLRPLAAAIDAADHTTTAVAAIDRAAPVPALARGYADLLAGKPPAHAAYLGSLRAAHADDLLIGALLKLGPDGYSVAPADIPEYVRLTAAAPDPWIRLLGIEQQAHALVAKGDRAGAETVLLGAQPLCAAGAPNFRCLKIAVALGDVYMSWPRLREARTAFDEAWQRARQSGQWEYQSLVLPRLAELATLADDATGGGLPMVRAFADEGAARAALEQTKGLRSAQLGNDACDSSRWAHERVAMVLVNQLRFDDAARELAAAPACDVARASIADATMALFVRAEVARVAGTADQRDALRREVNVVRATPNLTAGDRAFLDQTEARLVIDHDPAAGKALLEKAIATAAGAPASDANARRARGISYSLLAVTAAERGDGDAALTALADEEGVAVPKTCVLGIAAEDLTTIAAARDATGKTLVVHLRRSASAVGALTIDPATVVPSQVAAALAGCPVVDVIARPPYHGLSRLVPDALAWRYLTDHPPPPGPPGDRRIVIADVEPPAALGLPRLSAWNGGDGLRAAAATPDRVLAAIGSAGEVTVHAHGLVDLADASYLALSPDANGRYALTAEDVRAAHFTSSPLVILAACRASQAAPVLHEHWSLPAAFIHAGARAVIASSAPIPDTDAAAFFDAVHAKIIAGAPIAIAVRDARQQWLSEHRGDWVRDVIVFQ